MDLTRDKLVYHFKALWHAARLGDSRSDPVVSMRVLRDLGDFSIPHLRRALANTSHVEAQIRSAVVLHWLNQRDGLPFLLDTLLYHNSGKNLGKELLFAFGQIGTPDASHAIADAYCRVTGLSDTLPAAGRAIAVLRELRDPSIVPIIASSADRAPELFCAICEDLGVEGLEPLRSMAGSEDPALRLAAVLGLEQVRSSGPLDIITRLLRDPDERVRNAAAASILTITGPVSALIRLREALAAGYISPNAVQGIALLKPVDLPAILIDLLERFADGEEIPDACAAEAVAALSASNDQTPATVETICRLASAGKSPDFCLQSAHLLGAVSTQAKPESLDRELETRGPAIHGLLGLRGEIVESLLSLLTSEYGRVRVAAAEALDRWDEPIGKAFVQLLHVCRPPESLLKNLQAVFAGAQDVGAAVSDAVGHVSNWITRFTRETAERYAPEDSAWRDHEWILHDSRLPGMLNRLLNNACAALEASDGERIRVATEASACALKATGNLTRADAEAIVPTLKRACLFTFNSGIRARMTAEMGRNDAMLVPVRLSAAQAMISLKHPDTFGLLCEGLNSITDGVIETSAISLGVLGETRAISALQAASTRRLSAQTSTAISDAINRIRKTNPDTMTLLRGASSDHQALLRPAAERGSIAADTLVRPAASSEHGTSE
jgi:HEAT repeat protein